MDSEPSRVSRGEKLGFVDDLLGKFSSRGDDEGSTGVVGVGGGVVGFGDVSKTRLESGSEEGERLSGSGSGLEVYKKKNGEKRKDTISYLYCEDKNTRA